MGSDLSISCCTQQNQSDTQHALTRGAPGTLSQNDICLVKKTVLRNKQAAQAMLFTPGDDPMKSGIDLCIAQVLDNREVLGRVGFAKVEIIEKIQAVIRGSIVRRRIQLIRIAISLKSKAADLAFSQNLPTPSTSIRGSKCEDECADDLQKMTAVQSALKSRGTFNYFESQAQLEDIINSLQLKLSRLEYRPQAITVKEKDDPKKGRRQQTGLYVGMWNKETGLREGLGVYLWADGSLYEGFWSQGKTNGRGRLIHQDGDIYEGEWQADKNHGKGEYFHHNDGAIFTGAWFDDTQTGQGREQWPDGGVFEGNYLNGKKHGKGAFKWADGSSYQGDFSDNYIHGKGTYRWPDGRTYVGDWHLNMMHGKGLFTWDDGRCYEGDYFNDQKHGRGRYTWPDGRVYEGGFKQGQMDGFGIYKSQNQKERMGEWFQGKRVRWIERTTYVSYPDQ